MIDIYATLETVVLPDGTRIPRLQSATMPNSIDEQQRALGRVHITNIAPENVDATVTDAQKRYDDIVVIPGGYTTAGYEIPKDKISSIYGTKKTPEQ